MNSDANIRIVPNVTQKTAFYLSSVPESFKRTMSHRARYPNHFNAVHFILAVICRNFRLQMPLYAEVAVIHFLY